MHLSVVQAQSLLSAGKSPASATVIQTLSCIEHTYNGQPPLAAASLVQKARAQQSKRLTWPAFVVPC